MVGLDWEKVEGNKVKLIKNKIILDQFYFTSFSLNTPMETRYYLNSVGLGATYSSPSTMPEAIYPGAEPHLAMGGPWPPQYFLKTS